MNFDPLARHDILLGCFLITCLKWILVHFQIAAKMNFDSLLIFDAIIGTKVEQNSFWRLFESGSNFILNTWSENSPIICYASQVDQSSFGMHILHVIRSPSHSLLDQNSYHRVILLTINWMKWGEPQYLMACFTLFRDSKNFSISVVFTSSSLITFSSESSLGTSFIKAKQTKPNAPTPTKIE